MRIGNFSLFLLLALLGVPFGGRYPGADTNRSGNPATGWAGCDDSGCSQHSGIQRLWRGPCTCGQRRIRANRN